MIALLAHHLEPRHVPVLLAIFAAGFWVGWQLLGRLSTRAQPATREP